MEKTDLYNLTLSQLTEFVKKLGLPAYRAGQIFQWLYRTQISDFEQMSNLSKELRATLNDSASFERLFLARMEQSADGTVKFAFKLKDGAVIESVLIPEEDRHTLCISSQVGCAMGCGFCLTGTLGFKRNLTPGEIVGQIVRITEELPGLFGENSRINNLVFMGMGEPLANYRNVLPALDLLLSDYAYGLSRRRITVSTSGIVPHIEKLGDDCNVSLAVSLHAPNDELRDQLVPINRLHRISELLDACWRYAAKRANRFITFEYVMLRDVNDSIQDADELAGLLRNRPAKVNLIPFNPFPGNDFERSRSKTIEAFQSRLRGHGIVSTTRRTRGDDIDAACGQLAGKVRDRMRVRLGEKGKKAARV